MNTLDELVQMDLEAITADYIQGEKFIENLVTETAIKEYQKIQNERITRIQNFLRILEK